MLIRALGLYAILALGAYSTIEEPRFRLLTLIVVGAIAAKTVLAYLAQER
jgi:hypothetical protein